MKARAGSLRLSRARFDRLITLSTCAYAFENARYILIGRLVPAEQCAADILNTEE